MEEQETAAKELLLVQIKQQMVTLCLPLENSIDMCAFVGIVDRTTTCSASRCFTLRKATSSIEGKAKKKVV
jgi:hypothetical protein